ncbi:MAG: oxidoreductase [Sphingobium sp. 66-54]|nr:MAG: oxidoreductase [Sphingobium sp. 66-54]
MGRLVGKHALVTGGSSGIGLETARQFLAEGAKVAITGRSQDGLDQAKRELGDGLLTFRADASDLSAHAIVVDELSSAWPAVDILMCNAADPTQLPFEEWTPDRFDRLVATNLKGPFFLIQSLLPFFARPASIILIGSVSALIGHRHSTAYGATKAGLTALAPGLSYELKERGIRVNSISPGPIVTNAFKALDPAVRDALYEEFARQVPIGRNGQAIEIAKAAVYLGSDESGFTVAQLIRIDGGLGHVAVG